jgi:hypothetical protein
MFNAPAALLAARALTGDHLRPGPAEPPRRTTVTPARPAPAKAPAAEKKQRRYGRGRLAWR